MTSRILLLWGGAVCAALAACSEQPDQTPTAPNLNAGAAPLSCNFTTIKQQVRSEFTVTADANAVQSLVTTMKGFFPGSPAQATYVGFKILDQIATKGVAEGTPAAGSALTNSVLACMSVGAVALPIDFTAALSDQGAYSVRGWTGSAASFLAPDARVITSRPDATWVLEVPDCTTNSCGTSSFAWTSFPTGAPTRTGIGSLASQALADTVNGLFLAYGQPSGGQNFVACQGNNCDQLLEGTFNWNTIPAATFNPGVVVGECTVTGFLQHNPAGPNAAILGFVVPFCPGQTVADREAAPHSLVERAWRLLAPQPAYAALLLGGGAGAKGSNLSPWGVVNPVSVNLVLTQQVPKSGLSVGSPLRDKSGAVLSVSAFSIGGTPIQQGVVFAWIEAFNNSGSFVQVCNNWAYTDNNGVAKFPNAYLNKAGGYTLVFKTVGANFSGNSAPGTPKTPAGASPTSNLFNVKNGTPPNDNGCSTGVGGTPINSFVFNSALGPDGQTLPPANKYPPPYTLP